MIRIQIANEIDVKNLKAYGDSNLIIDQVHGEYEVRHEDLVPYHNTTIHMAERFRNFYIDHVPRQQNAHADALTSLAVSLALPARVAEKVLVYSHDLYCLKLVLENDQIPAGNLQVKKTLETLAGQSSGVGNSHPSTMHCTTFCLMTLKRRLPLEGKP